MVTSPSSPLSRHVDAGLGPYHLQPLSAPPQLKFRTFVANCCAHERNQSTPPRTRTRPHCPNTAPPDVARNSVLAPSTGDHRVARQQEWLNSDMPASNSNWTSIRRDLKGSSSFLGTSCIQSPEADGIRDDSVAASSNVDCPMMVCDRFGC
jgi:hypothetical protein